MLHRTNRRERVKLLLALGTLLGCTLLTAAVAVTTIGASSVHFAGDRNTFELAVAAGEGGSWTPEASDWVSTPAAESNPTGPDPVSLSLGSDVVFRAGEPRSYGIAVRNESSELSARVVLTISDPGSHSTGTSDSGRRLELFDQLAITVQSGGETLTASSAAAGSRRFAVAEDLKPGESRVFQVTVGLPADLDDSWNQAAADIQFRFDGESR